MAEELVGVAEIAERAGVTTPAAINWSARHKDFPEPVAELKMGRVWRWEDVAAWLADRAAIEIERLKRKQKAAFDEATRVGEEIRAKRKLL